MAVQDRPTTATFIPDVMSASHCNKHQAAIDEPCYILNDRRGVCNARAKRAGYDHPVSDKSRKNSVGSAESRRKNR